MHLMHIPLNSKEIYINMESVAKMKQMVMIFMHILEILYVMFYLWEKNPKVFIWNHLTVRLE